MLNFWRIFIKAIIRLFHNWIISAIQIICRIIRRFRDFRVIVRMFLKLFVVRFIVSYRVGFILSFLALIRARTGLALGTPFVSVLSLLFRSHMIDLLWCLFSEDLRNEPPHRFECFLSRDVLR